MDKAFKSLVKRAIKGDSEAIDLVIQEKMSDVVYITYLFADRDYEDVSQEVLYNIIKNIGTLKNPEYFETWMFRITKNICFTYNTQFSKKQKSEINMDLYESESVFPEGNVEFLPESFLLEKEKVDLVKGCINELPEQYKEVLVLRYFNNMSHSDIAQALDISVKAVYNTIARGQKALKGLIEKRTQTRYAFNPVSMGAVPMLTEILKADSLQVVSPQILEALAKNTEGQLVEAATTAAKGTGVVAKIVAIGLAATAVTGIVIGLAIDNNNEDIIQAVTETPITIMGTIPEEKRKIETLEDMIGESMAAFLIEVSNTGLDDNSQWQAFLEEAGMISDLQSDYEGTHYAIYYLDKEDKRLMIHTHSSIPNGHLTIGYAFGEQNSITIPSGLDFVDFFNI